MIKMPNIQVAYFPLRGGLNLITPPLSMPDGMCRDALNFECDTDGGYRRVAGYERFDGRTEPSSAMYYVISCTITGTFAAGNTVTGATSGATAVVIAVGTDYIAVTKVTGTFQSGENLSVAAVVQGVSTSTAIAEGAATQALSAQYFNLAADEYRNDIGAVPGSGAIRGVWYYSGKAYAFRNNAGGTACDMFVSSTSGWTQIDLGFQVAFSNANTSVGDGDTLTQGGVTATIKRVVVESGTLLSGTNTGRLIIGAPSGGNFAAGAATSTGGGSLTLSGAQTAITLPAGGRYEFVNWNFGGSSNTTRMYGANGVGNAFEYDGTVFVPIRTGMTTDTPKHITVHKNHLFLSFSGSVQHSSIGDPYSWSPITGAAELAMGDEVTGFLRLSGAETTDAMAIFTRNKTAVLYGTSSSDWNLVTLSFEAGAFDYTAQNIGQSYMVDELGIRQLQASQAYGNFEQAQISQLIRPFMEARIGSVIDSCIVRSRNQYRVFFNDSYCLHLTFNNNQLVGIMPIQHSDTMTCVCSVEGSTAGDEVILMGSDNGYVYRAEKGTSFDGEPIISYLNLSFSHFKGPRTRKRFRKAVYEITGNNYAAFDATYELGYATVEIEQGVTSSIETVFGNAFWDSFSWDSFFWDGRTLLPAEQDLTGTAENLSLIIRGSSDLYRPYTINSAIVQFNPRRLMR